MKSKKEIENRLKTLCEAKEEMDESFKTPVGEFSSASHLITNLIQYRELCAEIEMLKWVLNKEHE